MVNWPGFRSLIFGAISIFHIIFSIIGVQLKTNLFKFSKAIFLCVTHPAWNHIFTSTHPDTQPTWPARLYISADTRHSWCAIRTAHPVINRLKMPEVHRFWYSSPLICSTHFLGQIAWYPTTLTCTTQKSMYLTDLYISDRPWYSTLFRWQTSGRKSSRTRRNFLRASVE